MFIEVCSSHDVSLFISCSILKMPEGISAEDLMSNVMETLSDGVSKHKSVSFFEEQKSSSVSSQLNRLFGRQKPVHHLLGGGKCKCDLTVLSVYIVLQ